MRFYKLSPNQNRQSKYFFQIPRIEVFILCFCIAQLSFSQIIKDVDAVFPFHEGLAAIKKGDAWGFMNAKGIQVIDFRNDLVVTEHKKSAKAYPIFKDGKCLIRSKIDRHYYYGYIDQNGKTVIEPKFLNATNFSDGYALVIKLERTRMGSNSILGKSITNSKLEAYVIDTIGTTIKYLEDARGYIPSKNAPTINAKFISSNLVAMKGNNGKWTVHKFR